MQCTICGAIHPKPDKPCRICGFAPTAPADNKWDRFVEAAAIQSLNETLNLDESLLALTRGRLGGDWRRTVPIAQRPYAAPYVNLGITADRLLIQTIHNATAEPLAFQGNGIPLSDIASMTVSTTELAAPEHCARLSIELVGGSSFRLKAFGRLASGAQDIALIWQSIAGKSGAAPEPKACPSCSHPLDGDYKHCPFCGAKTAAKSTQDGGE